MKKSWYQSRSHFTSSKPFRLYAIMLIMAGLVLCLYLFHLKSGDSTQGLMNRNNDKQHQSLEQFYSKQVIDSDQQFNGERIVHLDLKGAPPKISYLKQVFPLIAKLGATGLLIEYEDMFPYDTNLVKNVSALNAYTLEDIREINQVAKANRLDVIPLVQTFGHLEFLLKTEDYRELREVPEYPQVICPTHPKTIDVLTEMIEQVIETHPNSKTIHIGADEVYYLGYCERCANAMNKYKLSKNRLFLEHINAITHNIHRNHPGLRILMWDDEFRSFSVNELKGGKGRLNSYIEPVVWKYAKDVYEELGPSLWDMYSEVFPKVWVASAFKGATGSNQYVTDVTHHVQNHRSWLSLISDYKNRINFQGIIITGWQRYDHFAVLCELLPVSIPSLAMSLRVIQGYNDSPLSPPIQVSKILGCEQPYALIGPAFGSPKCSYPGGDILENVLRLQQLRLEYDAILEDSRVKGWMSDYNKRHEFSNPQHIQSVCAPLGRIRGELAQVESDITGALFEVYDNSTVLEWKETYLKPFVSQVDEMIYARDKILEKEVWPRRPLTEI